MRIERKHYDALKLIKGNNGSTDEVPIHILDDLCRLQLVQHRPPMGTHYKFDITNRGLAGIEDRPIDDHGG